MDFKVLQLFDNIDLNKNNIELENIKFALKELQENAKEYHNVLNSISENENEFRNFINKKNDKEETLKNNQLLISEITINLKIAKEKYEALVKEKEQQFKNSSKELSEAGDIKTAIATTLMKYLGFKLELNYIDNETWETKFCFNNNMEINLYYNIVNDIFTLESIIPMPPKIELMKEFLKNTQDVTGLLHSAKNYFQNQTL